MASFNGTHFAFVMVPAAAAEPVVDLRSSKSGGLERDALRKHAELHFGAKAMDKGSQQYEVAKQLREGGMDEEAVADAMAKFGDKMAGQVEIITLCLPSPANEYQSVSIYCDGNNRFRQDTPEQLNLRATALAKACGHDIQVMGEVFLGKAHDDERVEWQRLDFFPEDVSVDSEWAQAAACANAGKNTASWSTTNVLQNFQQQQQKGSPAALAAAKAAAAQGDSKVVELSVDVEAALPACGYWMTQDTEEVEVRLPVPAGLPSKQFLCLIKPSCLVLGNKSVSKTEGSFVEGVAEALTAPGGCTLAGTVDSTDSTWSIAQEAEHRMLTITLVKAQKKHWKGLFAK